MHEEQQIKTGAKDSEPHIEGKGEGHERKSKIKVNGRTADRGR